MANFLSVLRGIPEHRTCGLHYFAVFVKDTSGNWSSPGADIDTVTDDATPPTDVTLLNVTATGTTSVNLSWSASVSTDVQSVRVVYKTSSTPANETDGTIFSTQGGTATSESVTGLTEKTRYYFAVFVKDTSGNWSSPGADIDTVTDDATPPTDVTLLNVTATASVT